MSTTSKILHTSSATILPEIQKKANPLHKRIWNVFVEAIKSLINSIKDFYSYCTGKISKFFARISSSKISSNVELPKPEKPKLKYTGKFCALADLGGNEVEIPEGFLISLDGGEDGDRTMHVAYLLIQLLMGDRVTEQQPGRCPFGSKITIDQMQFIAVCSGLKIEDLMSYWTLSSPRLLETPSEIFEDGTAQSDYRKNHRLKLLKQSLETPSSDPEIVFRRQVCLEVFKDHPASQDL